MAPRISEFEDINPEISQLIIINLIRLSAAHLPRLDLGLVLAFLPSLSPRHASAGASTTSISKRAMSLGARALSARSSIILMACQVSCMIHIPRVARQANLPSYNVDDGCGSGQCAVAASGRPVAVAARVSGGAHNFLMKRQRHPLSVLTSSQYYRCTVQVPSRSLLSLPCADCDTKVPLGPLGPIDIDTLVHRDPGVDTIGIRPTLLAPPAAKTIASEPGQPSPFVME